MKTPVDAILDMLVLKEMTKQPSQVACIMKDEKCWKAWDTTWKHKPKAIIPWSPGEERHRKRKHLTTFLWRGNAGETFDMSRCGRSHNTWVSMRMHTILNWTEPISMTTADCIPYKQTRLQIQRTKNTNTLVKMCCMCSENGMRLKVKCMLPVPLSATAVY